MVHGDASGHEGEGHGEDEQHDQVAGTSSSHTLAASDGEVSDQEHRVAHEVEDRAVAEQANYEMVL